MQTSILACLRRLPSGPTHSPGGPGSTPLCQLGHGEAAAQPRPEVRGQAAAGQECLPTSHPCVDLAPQPFSAHPTPIGGHLRERETQRGGETQKERQGQQEGERLGRTKKQQWRGVRGASGGGVLPGQGQSRAWALGGVREASTGAQGPTRAWSGGLAWVGEGRPRWGRWGAGRREGRRGGGVEGRGWGLPCSDRWAQQVAGRG